MKDSEELTHTFVEYAKEYLLTEMSKVKLVNLQMLKAGLTEKLSEVISERTDRKPMIIPIFMDITPQTNYTPAEAKFQELKA